MKLNKFAYLYSKPPGNNTLKIMKKTWKFTKEPEKIMEISWNFVGLKKWEPCMCGGGCAWQGGHAWQGVVGGMRGRGACMAGGTCMAGGCAWQGAMCGRRNGHCSGRYASYWNAFLLE